MELSQKIQKNPLLAETRSNESTDTRLWKSRPATLNPLYWHVTDSPWSPSLQPPTFPTRGEGSDTDLFASHKHVQEQASTATGTTVTCVKIYAFCSGT